MPFDGKEAQFETPAIRRARLIEALRGEMPDGFTFRYSTPLLRGECGTFGCAMGLACVLGITERPARSAIARALGISPVQANRIFYDPRTYGINAGYDLDEWNRVTPAMVADALEKIG